MSPEVPAVSDTGESLRPEYRKPVMDEKDALWEALFIIWREKAIIITSILVATGLACLYAFTATPRYAAEIRMLFEGKMGNALESGSALASAVDYEAATLGEVEALKSRSLAQRVIDALGLGNDAEFNPALQPKSELWTFFIGLLPDDFVSERRSFDAQQRVVDSFLRMLDVRQIPRSRAVWLTFTANDPEKAARILNSFAETFIEMRLENRVLNAQEASSWLAPRVNSLRARVESSQKAVEDYRREHSLFQDWRDTLVSQQLSDLNSKLTTARIERRAAEANLAQVKRLLKTPNQMATASQVLQSELIRSFRENEADLDRREGEMTSSHGPMHPAMIQLRAEKQRLEQKVQDEIDKIAQGLENDLSVARDREAALQRDVRGVKDEVSRQNAAAVGLRLLESEAEANKLELDKFLGAYMQASAQKDIRAQLRDVRIISPAPVPERPSFPPRTSLIVIAFFGSTVVGVLLAFGVEYLDRGFRSAEQIEMASGLPVLARVPVVSRMREEKVASYGVEFPNSTYAAAIRAIYSRLSLMHHPRPPQVVLVTSAEAGEGKSTTSLSLARQVAHAGLRVVLIDADFGRPSIGRLSGIDSPYGLGELLAGVATREEVTKRDPSSTAAIIVAGDNLSRDLALTDSRRFKQLLNELRTSYDLIVIDSPPAFGLADANIFSAVADATLMIVQWGSTPRRVFLYSIGEIAKFGGRIDGVVISKIDVKRQAAYGYGDSRY